MVHWYKRIRSEQKFNGIEELKEQIGKDKEVAIDYFKRTVNNVASQYKAIWYDSLVVQNVLNHSLAFSILQRLLRNWGYFKY